jgi:tetratricopeptide (TPR) repeat protein
VPAEPITQIESRLTVDPTQVFVMEDHDQALRVWRAAGVKGKVLVHVDAHHDCWWAERDADICIANFIAPALRDGLLGELFWVIPDASWESRSSRAHVFIHAGKILSKFPEKGAIEVGPHEIRTTLLGKPFHAVPLRYFRAPNVPVLLDIDTDFMLIDRVTYGGTDSYSRLPWCWPGDLLDKLADSGVRPELATVAYSVTGGYTPLPWKWLGDEAVLRLRGAGPEALRPMFLMREAAIAEHKDRDADAEALYREALALDARSAAVRFRLALLQRRAGRIDDARNLFREAVSLDPSYGTPYRSRGFFCQASRMYLEAEAEHRTVLEFNEEDPYPHLGLAQAFASQRRYFDAEQPLRRALELDPQLVDAYFIWGDVLRHLGRYEDAVNAYEKYLQLTLLGRRTMNMPICTAEPATFQLDARHFLVHARRAEVLFKLGKLEAAEQGFRMSLAAGDRRPKVRMGLARVSWRIGSREEAVCHAMVAIGACIAIPMQRAGERAVRVWMKMVATLRMR